jgi:hypothetical protein
VAAAQGLSSYAAIDVRGAHWNKLVEQDYHEYTVKLLRELGVLHYVVAKSARLGGWYSILGFGPGGVERSALDSDFPSTGIWFGSIAEYHRLQKNDLATECDAARLSGKPMAIAISTPPYRHQNYIGLPTWVWYRRSFRRITREYTRMYFREVLTAAISHIGYRKAIGFGLQGEQRSILDIESELALLRALRPRALDFMGPTQQVAIHVSELELLSRAEAGERLDDASAMVGNGLHRRLREQHIPCALFTDPSFLLRTFSRWQIRQSLTVVAFPREVFATAAAYALLMRQPARGGAFLVIDSTRAGVLAQELALNLRATLTPIGTVSLRSDPRQTATIAQIVLPQGVTRAFVFAFRDRPPGEPVAPYTESCALLLTQEVPALGAGGGLVLAPASVQTPRPTDVYANNVSDGLNSFMAVSWVTDQDFPPQPLSVTVNAAWAARFSPAVVRGFTAQTVGPPNIAPEETRYIHIEADIHPGVVGAINAGGITEVIRDLLSLLVGLARQGYAVDHGIELLKMAEKTASPSCMAERSLVWPRWLAWCSCAPRAANDRSWWKPARCGTKRPPSCRWRGERHNSSSCSMVTNRSDRRRSFPPTTAASCCHSASPRRSTGTSTSTTIGCRGARTWTLPWKSTSPTRRREPTGSCS